jgi:hypothetical protein
MVLAILSAACQAEIVDRVAVNIGRGVITEAQVVEEIRAQSFIEDQPVDLSVDNRRKALDRLVDQFLVRRELEFSRFPAVSEADAAPAAKSVRDRFPGDDAYRDALAKYEIAAADVNRHVSWTLTMLRFVEYRFQPGVQITAVQVRQEYTRQAAQWKTTHATEMPPLDQVQADIEKIVRQRLVDASLDRWLGEVRTQTEIVYRGEYKQ